MDTNNSEVSKGKANEQTPKSESFTEESNKSVPLIVVESLANELLDEDSVEPGDTPKKDYLNLTRPFSHSTDKIINKKSEDKENFKPDRPEDPNITKRKSRRLKRKSKAKKSRKSSFIIILIIFAACVTMVLYQIAREKDPNAIDLLKTTDNTTGMNLSSTFDCFTFKGDGFCDDEANNEFCDFDEGDCCDAQSDRSQCSECWCKIEYFQTKSYLDCDKVNIIHDKLSWATHGDGNCDEDFNNYEQFFDAGDCCLPNPTVFYEGEKFDSAYGFSNPWFSNPPRPCLENECICIPNNLVCNATQLGDGKCQDYNNGPLCDYDLGDCCLRWMPDFDIDECCNCLCHLGYDHFLTNNIPM